MKLSHLLNSVIVKSITCKKKDGGLDEVDVASVHCIAQDVKKSGIFVAVQGNVTDGHDYVDVALENGAAAIITQKPIDRDSIIIEVENTRKALSAISAAFYNNPSENLFLIGITGTNGKTTTAYLTESILINAGFRVGVIGTVNYRYSGKVFNSPVTTPESINLQRILAEMLKEGITHVVMEVSSHAIDQHRIANCWFDIGVFTNLTQDHLDYHGDMNSYWSCKKRFFTENLMTGPKKGRALSIINCDDRRGKELAGELKAQGSKMKVFELPDNIIRPSEIKCGPSGIAGRISTPKGNFDFKSSLVGRHNLKNIISATGVGISLNLMPEVIKKGIEDLTRIPGRLECVPNASGRFVYIDYAHTPDALENVLSSLRAMVKGRIICVFGCGGDRDKDKRPKMGEIAGRLSDIAVVTSDNPRTEAPLDIIAQVLDGIRKTSMIEYDLMNIDKLINQNRTERGYVMQPDRKKGIELAVKMSRPEDIILIAGKGHENYQIIGSKTISFDDKKEAEKALRKLKTSMADDYSKPMQWTMADILDATNGDLLTGDVKSRFSGISIDSRSISSDDLFVAVRGNIHDGFSFTEDVINKGVRGLIINRDNAKLVPSEKWREKGIVCIAVENTTKALGDLATFNRKRADVSVVAITGSNGKTSTKDMTAAVVARKFRTLSTKGNLNNEIGLPLTLFRLCRCHEWAVLELGTNSPGEIGRLADICLPDIGVITNISRAHLKGLGSIEGVMQAKGELLEKINFNGTAILNADDRRVVDLANKSSGNVLFYGLSDKADIRAESLIDKACGVSFTLILPSGTVPVNLGVFGNFMVSNALAAAAVGYVIGQSPMEIKAGLEDFKPAHGRMNILKIGQAHIIDDTYNSNPDSMKAAIMALKSLRGKSRGAIITGDMFELGEYAESMHKEIGLLSAKTGISKLYITGEFAESVAAGAREENDSLDIFTGDKQEILEDLAVWLMPGDWVLVKGSRAMGMETIIKGLRNYVLSVTLSSS